MSFTKKTARVVLALVSVVLFIALYFTNKISFSYDFESFFPDNDPALPFFKEYRKAFGHDNEFVLIALQNEKGIFKKDFLSKADTLSKQLKRLPFVEEIVSPSTLKKTSLQGMATTQIPLLHCENEDLYKDDSAYIYKSPQWKNSFFSSDAKSICLYIKTNDGLSKKKSDSLATSIKRFVGDLNFDSFHLGGRIFAASVFLEKLQKQFVLFILISLVFVTILLWVTFRNIQAVLLPISLIILSVIITFGIMGALGKPIEIMTAMIPTMIFVAGMSDVMHFYTKYTDEIAAGNNESNTLKLIFKEVAQPTLLTLISTVVGFLSLCYSGIKPVRDFGIYTSVGIVVAFILTYTYLPAMLRLKIKNSKAPSNSPEGGETEYANLPPSGGQRGAFSIDAASHKLFFWVIRKGKTIALLTCLLVIVSVFGLFKIVPDQKLLDDLSDKEPVKQDFLFFEQHYGGIRPLEVDISIKDKSKTVWSYEVMRQLNAVDSFVTQTYQPGFLLSPAMMIKSVNEAYDGDFIFPNDTADFNRDVKLIITNKHKKEFKKLVTTDSKRSHISAKIKDFGSLTVDKYNALLTDFINKHTDTSAVKLTITGTTNLIDLNNSYLVTNTMQGLGTGIIVLALLTLFIHRSLKMVLVFLIPNVVPLLIMAGIMGFFHIPLKASTAIFFSIAFGIATDDTIHFISRFKLELRKTTSPLRAFKRTYAETGKPVFLTTLILLGGFISLVLSDFESIRLFGLLTCLTLLIALLAEVVLLPVLLMALFKKKK
ncbi:MAG TPA: MMPL family transporter [Bacteroidia bacterium]